MTNLVALLRGVNVGGITVKSADLRELFVELGFDDVRTVLATFHPEITGEYRFHEYFLGKVRARSVAA